MRAGVPALERTPSILPVASPVPLLVRARSAGWRPGCSSTCSRRSASRRTPRWAGTQPAPTFCSCAHACAYSPCSICTSPTTEAASSSCSPQGRDTLKYCCRCSFLEIYNENITDLLNPKATNLSIREDTHGCFVDFLSETEVLNGACSALPVVHAITQRTSHSAIDCPSMLRGMGLHVGPPAAARGWCPAQPRADPRARRCCPPSQWMTSWR